MQGAKESRAVMEGKGGGIVGRTEKPKKGHPEPDVIESVIIVVGSWGGRGLAGCGRLRAGGPAMCGG